MKRAAFLFLSIIVISSSARSFAFQSTSQGASNAEVQQLEQGAEIHSSPEPNIEIQQKKQEGLIPQVQQPEEKNRPEAARYLGKAWGYLRRGNYHYAIEIFTTLSSYPALMWDAKYGLAMCYSKQRDTKRAVPLLKELIQKKFHTHDALINLLSFLNESKEYTEAFEYSKMLEGKEGLKWQETIRTGALSLALKKAEDTDDFTGISDLIRTNYDLLEACKAPGVFLEAGAALADNGDPYALTALNGLLRACPEEWDVRLGIFYALKEVMKPSEILREVEREVKRSDLDTRYKNKLTDLQVSVLSGELAAAGPDSPEVEKFAGEILHLRPDDRGTMTILLWWYFRGGQYDKSLEGFSRLVKEEPANQDYASGLIYSLIKLKRFDEALKIANRYYRLDKDFSVTMRDRIYEAKAGNAYDNENYEEAREIYSELHKRFPGKKEYAAGLAYALLKLKRPDEALNVAENYPAKDEDFLRMRIGIYQQKAGEAYDNKDYKLAESYLKQVLALDPDNIDAKTLLAWSLFNGKRRRDALPIFLSLFELRKDPAFANAILNIYDTSGDKKAADAFAEKLALSYKADLKKSAADFFFSGGYPLQAAAIYRDPETCYHNADKPSFEIVPSYRRRSGTEAFSRLMDYNMAMGLRYPFSADNGAYFSLTGHSLSAGPSPANPFAGNASLNLPQINNLKTSEDVVVPEIKFTHNGVDAVSYSIALGASPIGGVISPAPTFSALIGDKIWNISIHQASVDESILSYTGLKDPYTDNNWGRVLRTGIEGELKPSWLRPYWLSLRGGYDLYHGSNVKNNHSWQGTVSFGRTFLTDAFNISPGIFFTTQTFKNNTDFFTFGNGGYYSPQHYYNGGPFVSLQTKECKSFIAEGMFGVTYFEGLSNEALQYPIGSSIAQIRDAVYNASKSEGLGYTAHLKGEIILNNHFAVGGDAGASKASQYTELKVGFDLRYYFELRSRLLRNDLVSQ